MGKWMGRRRDGMWDPVSHPAALGFCNLFGNGIWLGVSFDKMYHACSQVSPVRKRAVFPNEERPRILWFGRPLCWLGLVMYESGTRLSMDLIIEGIDAWIVSFKLSSQILALKPSLLARITLLNNMSERIIALSSEEILDTRVDEAPSHVEALTQGQNRVSTEMMLASRPRSYDR